MLGQHFAGVGIAEFVAVASTWLILVVSGFFYFRIADVDPHNPAKLPGRWSRALSAVLAATSLVASTFFSGNIGLFLASLALGTILDPGLNDPYYPRRDENSSWLGRAVTSYGHKKVGGLILKLVGTAVGYVSSLIWPPSWLPILTALAMISIATRAYTLVVLGEEGSIRDLKEVFGDDVPPELSSLDPKAANEIRETPDRVILRSFPSPLNGRVVASKKADDLRSWRHRQTVFPALIAALVGMTVWIIIAGTILLSPGSAPIDAGNFDGAYAIIGGIVLSALLHRLIP